MGDMKIDVLKFESHDRTKDYLDSVFSDGFVPIITKPTRYTRSSPTLFANIYTNNITSSTISEIIIMEVADHFGTFHSTRNNS